MSPEEFKELVTNNFGDESYILIIFEEIGQVKKNMAMNHVMPEQILALASELEVIGKNMLIQRENARFAQDQVQQNPKIVVPKPQIEVP